MHGTIESRFRVEWRLLAGLGPVAGEWRTLAARALEPNVFYEPAFALAAMPLFGAGVGAVLVWSGAPPQKLVGFFPGRIERRRYGIAFPITTGWTHPYAPLGVPLVDRDMGEAVIAAWLDHVSHHPQWPGLVLLPYLPLDGPFARALDAAVERRGGRAVSFAQHRRALLAPAGSREDYLDHTIGHKKRKELRRQRKRLADQGALTASRADDPAGVAPALDDFLGLEVGGWKGRAGTAAADHSGTRQFLHAAVSALASEGQVGIDRLLVAGNPIAAAVTLRSGATAWTWKVAYDERFARFSPGLQLMLDVTQGLLAAPEIARANSCATQNHPMIDHIWRERLLVADRLICPGPEHSTAFALARRLEGLRRRAIGGAKAVRDVLRRG